MFTFTNLPNHIINALKMEGGKIDLLAIEAMVERVKEHVNPARACMQPWEVRSWNEVERKVRANFGL